MTSGGKLDRDWHGFAGYVGEDLGDDVVGGDAFGFGFEIWDEPVTQRGGGGELDVVEADVKAALGESADFAGEQKSLRATRAATETKVLVADRDGGLGFWVRGEDEANGVVLDVRGNGDLANNIHELQEFVFTHHAIDFGATVFGGAREDLAEFGAGGIAHEQLEKETVELRFGQRVSAFLIDWVLRRHDEERFFEAADFAAGSDTVLLHRLEQGRLGFGRGAIDFVGEKQVRKDRPFLKLKFAATGRRFHDQIRAEDVGGHEIGRELDAIEGEIKDLGKGANQQRFSKARHPFEENVTAGKQCSEGAFDDGILADDDLADFGAEFGVGFAEGGDLLFGVHFEQRAWKRALPDYLPFLGLVSSLLGVTGALALSCSWMAAVRSFSPLW